PFPLMERPPMFDEALGVTSYLFETTPWPPDMRCYGQVSQPVVGPPLLAVLPLPWFQTMSGNTAKVDVLVESNIENREWPERVSVIVRDDVMASVFGYLSSGDLSAAARVTDTAVKYLY